MKTFNNNTMQKFRGRNTEIRYFVHKNFKDIYHYAIPLIMFFTEMMS